QAAFAFTDVPSSYWDYTAIQYVASQHNWMADYNDGTFHPRGEEHRKRLARALVLMYAPSRASTRTSTSPTSPTPTRSFRTPTSPCTTAGSACGPATRSCRTVGCTPRHWTAR